MTDAEMTDEPISASADGKRNSFTLACRATQQKMNYAACLNRIATLDNDPNRAPKDWVATCSGVCPARTMRAEELAAGKALYFTPRASLAIVVEGARQWVMGVGKSVKKAISAPAPAAAPRSVSMLDAMGDAGDFAAAINAAAAPVKTMTVTKPLTTPPKVLSGTTEGLHPQFTKDYVRKTAVALPGETPLQMALRMKKERAGA